MTCQKLNEIDDSINRDTTKTQTIVPCMFANNISKNHSKNVHKKFIKIPNTSHVPICTGSTNEILEKLSFVFFVYAMHVEELIHSFINTLKVYHT